MMTLTSGRSPRPSARRSLLEPGIAALATCVPVPRIRPRSRPACSHSSHALPASQRKRAGSVRYRTVGGRLSGYVAEHAAPCHRGGPSRWRLGTLLRDARAAHGAHRRFALLVPALEPRARLAPRSLRRGRVPRAIARPARAAVGDRVAPLLP